MYKQAARDYHLDWNEVEFELDALCCIMRTHTCGFGCCNFEHPILVAPYCSGLLYNVSGRGSWWRICSACRTDRTPLIGIPDEKAEAAFIYAYYSRREYYFHLVFPDCQ
jgi:hypothetical protein